MYRKTKAIFKNYILSKKLKKEKRFFDYKNLKFKSKNVLIIDEIIPEYNKDSGSRRLTEIIKLLLKNDVAIFLLADLKQYKYKSDYINKFKELGVNVYEPCIDENGNLLTKELFIKRIAPKINVAWLHRPTIFNKFNNLIKSENPDVKLVFDMVDFHYVRLMREYQLHKDENLKKEADKFLKIELDNCKKADAIIAISITDQALLKQHFNEDKKVTVISNIHQYIKKKGNFTPFKDRSDLLFVGSFRHQPNQDAVFYLRNEIMPLVWKSIPDLKITIIGSYVTQEIQELQTNTFKVVGFVDELLPYLQKSKLFVAPLRFGAGIKGKIGQSLEHSLPLVTTDVGAEGFDFGSQKEIMVANEKENIAQKIIDLYTTEKLWDKASASCEDILKPFSLLNTEKQVLKLING